MTGRLLSELSGPAADAAIGSDSIVLVPTGAIEHHGPHLPLATDQLIAEAVAGAAVTAAAGTGLDVWRLPTLAYTKSDEHSWAPGTVWLDWDTMYKTCLEIGRGVAAMGAGSIVFANGHGGNTALLQVVLREIRKLYGLRTFAMPTLSMNRTPPNGEGLDEHGLGVHGGAAETSIVMHLRPDLVDLSVAERWVPEHLADFELLGFNGRPVSFGWLSNDFDTPGVLGDPTQANPEYGALLYDASITQAVASLQEIARFRHSAVRR
jgi:creatinine amidohydrolase